MKLKEALARQAGHLRATHSAQIAAQADCHMRISKSVSTARPIQRSNASTQRAEKYEIARITGGLDVTELQLKSAEEMLRNAGICKTQKGR